MKNLLIVLSAILILGCQEEVKSTDYYLQHRAELEQTLKDCVNEGGRNCANARDAKQIIVDQELAQKKTQRDAYDAEMFEKLKESRKEKPSFRSF